MKWQGTVTIYSPSGVTPRDAEAFLLSLHQPQRMGQMSPSSLPWGTSGRAVYHDA